MASRWLRHGFPNHRQIQSHFAPRFEVLSSHTSISRDLVLIVKKFIPANHPFLASFMQAIARSHIQNFFRVPRIDISIKSCLCCMTMLFRLLGPDVSMHHCTYIPKLYMIHCGTFSKIFGPVDVLCANNVWVIFVTRCNGRHITRSSHPFIFGSLRDSVCPSAIIAMLVIASPVAWTIWWALFTISWYSIFGRFHCHS